MTDFEDVDGLSEVERDFRKGMQERDEADIREYFQTLRSNWLSGIESLSTDFAHFNAFLLDVFGEIPPSRIDGAGELHDDVLKAYLMKLPIDERLVIDCAYNLFGGLSEQSPREPALLLALNMEREEFRGHLASGIARLRASKDPFLSAIAQAPGEPESGSVSELESQAKSVLERLELPKPNHAGTLGEHHEEITTRLSASDD